MSDANASEPMDAYQDLFLLGLRLAESLELFLGRRRERRRGECELC